MTSQVQEALAAANVTPLIQKRIDPMILEYQRRYSPLVRVIPDVKWDSTSYYFNLRTARPNGGFVTDGGARPITNSTYVQQQFNIRLLQTVGAITGFAQAVTRSTVGDLKQLEVDGSIQSLLWDIENAVIWGSDPATNFGIWPQFTGLDSLVSNWTAGAGINAYQNVTDVNAALALRHLDLLIDMVESNAAMPVGTQYMIVASPTAVSKIAQLLTNQQRFVGTTEVAAGLTVMTYRDIPLMKSSFLPPRTSVMAAVTSATNAAGGSLAAGTYNYRVSAVIARFGEIQASASVAQVSTGATSTITLNISTPTGPDGAAPILYKVYRTAGAAGTEVLVGIVDANDTTGTAVSAIIDTGTNLLTNSAANTGPAAYVTGGTAGGNQAPRSAGMEDIFLIPRDPNFLVRPYVRDVQFLPLAATTTAPDTLPYAAVSDTCLAIRAPKYVGRLTRVSAAL